MEVSLATADADADHAALHAAGVDADVEVMRMGDYVPPMFTFRDPDGNRFRIVERLVRGLAEQPLDEHAVLPLAVEPAVAPLDADLVKPAARWTARLAALSANTREVSL